MSDTLLSALRSRFTTRPTKADAAIAEAALRSDRFRQEREPDWQRLEAIVTALEKRQLGRIADADLRTRLVARGDGLEAVERRMAAAHDEIAHWAEFDHVLVNRDFMEAVAASRAVLHAARLATPRQVGLAAFVNRL